MYFKCLDDELQKVKNLLFLFHILNGFSSFILPSNFSFGLFIFISRV